MRLEGKSILQYRCAALVREVTELVVKTDSEEYLVQLEEQLRNIYNAVRQTLPIQEVPFRLGKVNTDQMYDFLTPWGIRIY